MDDHEDAFHNLVRAGMARGRRMRSEAAAAGMHGISVWVRGIFARDGHDAEDDAETGPVAGTVVAFEAAAGAALPENDRPVAETDAAAGAETVAADRRVAACRRAFPAPKAAART